MKRLAALALALVALALWRLRRDARAWAEADLEDDDWLSELVPMGAWFPHTATFDLSTDPPTVTTLADWRN